MTQDEKDLFNELIVAAGKLATVTDQANNVLSEEHQTMTQPSVDEVRAILARCPQPTVVVWDGKLREQDLKIETFLTAHEVSGGAKAVKIVHLPTGIGRESQSKPTEHENREVAMKALTAAVDREYTSRSKA